MAAGAISHSIGLLQVRAVETFRALRVGRTQPDLLTSKFQQDVTHDTEQL